MVQVQDLPRSRNIFQPSDSASQPLDPTISTRYALHRRRAKASICNTPRCLYPAPAQSAWPAYIDPNAILPGVTRGARGQLAYDPDQLDDKTRQRVLRNRASARLARERLLERRQEERAELLRLTEMNSVLEAQLQAAMRWIEAHQCAPPPQA